MKEVVLKPRPAARGSVGEVGVRRAMPVTKLDLKPRPLARGTVGLVGLRRAMPVEDPGRHRVVDDKTRRIVGTGISTACTASSTPLKDTVKGLQKGEIAVSLSEDEDEVNERGDGKRNELAAQ